VGSPSPAGSLTFTALIRQKRLASRMARSVPLPDVTHQPRLPTVRRAPQPLGGHAFYLVTALVDMISIGLIIPVLPALVGSFTERRRIRRSGMASSHSLFSLANFFWIANSWRALR